MRRGTPASVFALLLGCFLLVEGIWGLMDPPVFGILATNDLHAVIHIVLAIIGLCMGVAGRGRNYSIFVGSLLLIVGICFFIPGADKFVTRLLNISKEVALLNIGIGVLAFLMVALSRNLPNRYRY
jgi:uncharacterized membrane protein